MLERVINFISKQTGFPQKKITLTTSLKYDIGLGGDDAIDFFNAFAKEFDVKINDVYKQEIIIHFGHEGWYFYQGLALIFLFIPILIFLNYSIIPFWILLIIVLFGFYIFRFILSIFLIKNSNNILVKDLVQAATNKNWSKSLKSGRKGKGRKGKGDIGKAKGTS